MPTDRRPWTDADDRDLREAVEELGNDWPAVTERIGRSSVEAVRIRYTAGVRDGRWPKARQNRQAELAAKIPLVKTLYLRGVKINAIAHQVGLSEGTVTAFLRRAQAAGELPRRILRAAVRPKWTPAAGDSPADVWQRVEAVTSRDLVKHADQHEAVVDVQTEAPIAVAVVSDQHIRLSGPVDLKRMREDAELVAQTEGLYAILGGDGVDNHIKHHAAMIHGGTEPGEEWRLYDHYLGMFGDKILAVISGNHDDWTSDQAGVSKIRDLAEQRRLFFAPDEVTLRLEVGQQPYTVTVRHQYRFNSQLNQVHTVKQLWTHGNTRFDIGVVCHHHVPALEPFVRHGRVIWGARPGSYQLTSAYARRYGHARQFPTCPTFILWPDRREIIGFLDVRQAAAYLTWLRSDAAQNRSA